MIALDSMKKLKLFSLPGICVLILFLSIFSAFALEEEIPLHPVENSAMVKYIPALVLNVREITLEEEDTDALIPGETVKRLWVQLLSGQNKGKRIFIEHRSGGNWGKMAFPGYNFDHLKPGDKLLLHVSFDENGIKSANIDNHLRSPLIFRLLILFVLIMLIVAGIKGLKALLALVLTGAGIVFILLPLILKGYSPILIATLLSIVIALLTFLLLNGWSKKTLAAIAGTTGGFIVAGTLSYISGKLANLSGFNSEEAGMLRFIPQTITFNFQGILFAGIIIGALGAIMDVAMSIASSMNELRQQHPLISFKEHVRSGINIGKDIIGTMSNTLILAYTGSSIPLMLLFVAYQMPLIRVINLDIIATEFVRALSGTIGLAITIPITVLCSALLQMKASSK